jgi:hypothetical protein
VFLLADRLRETSGEIGSHIFKIVVCERSEQKILVSSEKQKQIKQVHLTGL